MTETAGVIFDGAGAGDTTSPRDDVVAWEQVIERFFVGTMRDPARLSPFGDAVGMFAVLLRDRGQSIDEVIVRLKVTLRRAQAQSRHNDFRLGDFYAGAQLADAAMGRCIEAFHGRDDATSYGEMTRSARADNRRRP